MGILLLVSLIENLWLINFVFSHLSNNFLSTLLMDIFGSIISGNPINWYILVGFLGNIKAYLLPITTFLISWISVWFIQLPAEIYFFGKKFAISRNLISFILSILIAYVVFILYNIF